MSRWVSITTANLENNKVAALVDALRTAALAEGEMDRSPLIIEEVVAHIRAAVGSCERNTLDADETRIPRDLRGLAIRLILVALKNALEIPLTDAETMAWKKDERILERIAECKLVVASPDNPIEEDTLQQNNSIPEIAGRPSRFRRDQQEGA